MILQRFSGESILERLWLNLLLSVVATVAFELILVIPMASLVAQTVKHLSTMRETWVRSLGWENSPGEGNGNPLQYYSLENPMDRGAW